MSPSNRPERRRRRGRGRGRGSATIPQQQTGQQTGNVRTGERSRKRRSASGPEVRPTGPPAKRPVVALHANGGIRLGCPMLSRTRLRLPVFGNNPAPRCALGWALHSEDEVAFCLLTEDLTQCWQAHPERVPELREQMESEASAAD